MPRAEWRSPAAYEDLRSLDAPGFAWEFLSRNPAFEHDRIRLEQASEDHPLSADELTASRGAGGCDFAEPAPAGEGHHPLWTAAHLPRVTPVTRLPPDLIDPNQRVESPSLGPVIAEAGPERLIERRENLFRLHIVETPDGQTPCVILPLDQLFDLRANSALRLWRALTGRDPGPNASATTGQYT
jgi:hypothetical protein